MASYKKELKKIKQIYTCDSEHFSIYYALKIIKFQLENIYLTASGGPL